MRVCFSLFKYRYISIYIYIYMTFMSACMSVLLEKMRGGLDEGWRLQGIFHCTASALPSVIYDVSSAVEAMLRRIARKNVQINVERKTNKQTKKMTQRCLNGEEGWEYTATLSLTVSLFPPKLLFLPSFQPLPNQEEEENANAQRIKGQSN